MKFDPPILSRGGLSGRIYVITHGTVEPHPNPDEAAKGMTLITASRKYDVTDQFEALTSPTEPVRRTNQNEGRM